MDHKLAAIFAADVVGFSGQVARDEEATLKKLEQLSSEVIDTHVEAHRGRVFKDLGDGVLAEFSSTLEAVKCAISIQRRLALRPTDTDQSSPALRIGISVGDVVAKGNDLLGEGGNTAARLETATEPGGIAVSDEVMLHVCGKVDVHFEDCGHVLFKGSDSPIHVYKSQSNSARQQGGLFDFDEADIERSTTGGCL